MANTSPPKPSADVMAGETFGKYVLVKRLAMGGMAEVCLARLQGTAGFNKLVVIKQVLPAFAEHPQFIEMFLDEGRLAAKLSHPNIAGTFELGEENGRYYLAMEFVPGESLYSLLKRCREKNLLLPSGCALRVVMQLLEALDYAHSLDDGGAPLHIVHRDVTPSNVMVTHHGAIKLLDFGIARAATQVHRTEAGRVKGKGGYMAPEQCRSSRVDHRADIYGAGAVLYLMATGMKPFEHLPAGTDLLGQMNATMEGSYLRPHEVKKDVDPRLERIIVKAMALKPDDRYQSAGEMLEDLERYAGEAKLFPSARELGDFVKKLFPKSTDDASDLTREPSSSRATPGPPRDEKLATSDPSSTDDPEDEPGTGESPAPSTRRRLADVRHSVEEQGTAPSAAAARAAKPPVPPLLVASGGAVLLVFGITLALFLSAKPERAPEPQPIPRPAVAAAPANERPEAKQPAPAPAALEPAIAAAEAPPVAQVAEPQPEPESVAPPTQPATPKKKKVVKKEKDKDKEPAAVVATGTLTINAYPWAKVRLKGKELGVTPLKLTLPVGTHQLELENPAVSVKKTVTLTVREGAETTHFEKLQ